MPDQTPSSTNSGRNLGPEDIANHPFPSARKGLDPEAVRRFLAEVAAQVRDLRSELAEFRSSTKIQQAAPAVPVAAEMAVDEEVLTRVLGEEMTRVLQTARESAHAIVLKAERQAAEIITGAEKISQTRKSEAAAAASSLVEHSRAEAAELIEKTKNECRVMIEEARETRLKILADLADRRRTLLIQLEQVRAGKESMVNVVESVASRVSESIDAVRAQLVGAEESSRIAADRAASEFEAAIAVSDDVDALAEQTLARIPLVKLPQVVNEPEQLQTTPTNARVFDIEREQLARPVSVSTARTAANSDSSASIPSFLTENGVNDSAPGRVPDSTPTMGQEPKEAVAAERVSGGVGLRTGDQEPVKEAGVGESTREERPVDQLFAKIRASRESKVADAQRVLSGDAEVTPKRNAASRRRFKETAPGDVIPGSISERVPAAPETVQASRVRSVPAEEGANNTNLEVDEGPRQRRDRELEPAHLELSRSLKRVLREEQNLLLDALRNRKKNASLKSLLPAGQTRSRIIDAVTPGVRSAFEAGHGYLGESPTQENVGVEAGEIVATTSGRVADEILGSLNARLAPSFEKSSDVEAEISEIVGSAFREWKAARIEELSYDYVVDAFGSGEVAYARSGNMPLVWNLDDRGSGCPDCDDNGMAGKVAAGESFPTGHQHPPIHPGCRCFLTS